MTWPRSQREAPPPSRNGQRRSNLLNVSPIRIAESTRRSKVDLTALEMGRSA